MQLTHLMTRKLIENNQTLHRYTFHIQLLQCNNECTVRIEFLDETGRLISKQKLQVPAIKRKQGHFISFDDPSPVLATVCRYRVLDSSFREGRDHVTLLEGKFEDLTPQTTLDGKPAL